MVCGGLGTRVSVLGPTTGDAAVDVLGKAFIMTPAAGV